jgi:hypothetical protein
LIQPGIKVVFNIRHERAQGAKMEPDGQLGILLGPARGYTPGTFVVATQLTPKVILRVTADVDPFHGVLFKDMPENENTCFTLVVELN